MIMQKLFREALTLEDPWTVTDVAFSLEEKRLDITIDFARGSTFCCPVCGEEGARAYDTHQESWRHLNFFQYEAYIHARVPRVRCPNKCGIKKVNIPWARAGSGFTKLFEALIMMLSREVPVAVIARMLGEQDTRIWRIIHYYVGEAREKMDFKDVRSIAVDETSNKKKHDYISLFYDMDRRRILFGTPGKDASTVERFCEDLKSHGGNPESILQATCDMSPAFIAGITTNLPNAAITFDHFHIMKIMQDAVDRVRREESKETHLLTHTRYLWLKNPNDLKDSQRQKIDQLSPYLKTGRAYRIRLSLQEFFLQPTREDAEAFLTKWYFWATHSRLDPVIKAAKSIKEHWEGVLNWFDSGISTGVLEGINSLIQAAKARARGYRTMKNFITMAYLIAGDLTFDLPT